MRKLKTNAKALLKDIAVFKQAYTNNIANAHALLVKSLAHAAEHGDPDPLNALMSSLTSNDREAAANFVRRCAAVVGGWNMTDIPASEVMAGYVSNGQFLTKTKEGYRVLANSEHSTAKAAKSKFTLLAPTIVEPDGKNWKYFLTRNNFAESKVFGDENVRERLDALIKTATKGKKNTKTEVSPEIIAALEAAQKAIGAPTMH